MPKKTAGLIILAHEGQNIDWGSITGEGIRAAFASFKTRKDCYQFLHNTLPCSTHRSLSLHDNNSHSLPHLPKPNDATLWFMKSGQRMRNPQYHLLRRRITLHSEAGYRSQQNPTPLIPIKPQAHRSQHLAPEDHNRNVAARTPHRQSRRLRRKRRQTERDTTPQPESSQPATTLVVAPDTTLAIAPGHNEKGQS